MGRRAGTLLPMSGDHKNKLERGADGKSGRSAHLSARYDLKCKTDDLFC